MFILTLSDWNTRYLSHRSPKVILEGILDNNYEDYRHIDTPLTVEHEFEVLKGVGFKNITSSNVDKKEYRLIKARK